ncbi:MAG: hypothetical protein M5U28_02075 [Sandaracinaceae bacterium]|nr:hypothetical protein [Sandaracinaceae bacterium]
MRRRIQAPKLRAWRAENDIVRTIGFASLDPLLCCSGRGGGGGEGRRPGRRLRSDDACATCVDAAAAGPTPGTPGDGQHTPRGRRDLLGTPRPARCSGGRPRLLPFDGTEGMWLLDRDGGQPRRRPTMVGTP